MEKKERGTERREERKRVMERDRGGRGREGKRGEERGREGKRGEERGREVPGTVPNVDVVPVVEVRVLRWRA